MASIFRAGLLDGHVAIITGGASGIGFSIARTAGELGARVAICGRNRQKLDTACESLARRGLEVFGDVCDIRDVDAIARYVSSVEARFGKATLLVNNAGGQFPTTAETLSARGWDAVIRNNLCGTFYFTQAVATRHMMAQRKGRIVNIIANIARGFPGMIHTGAARAGVENMTKTLSVEWAPHNIQVNAVAPGIIRTSGVGQYPPELVEACRRRTPMKRLGTPEEVAQLVIYLLCDASSFVTGETWYIDGGAHLWGDNWTLPDLPHDIPEAVLRLADPSEPEG